MSQVEIHSEIDIEGGSIGVGSCADCGAVHMLIMGDDGYVVASVKLDDEQIDGLTDALITAWEEQNDRKAAS